MNLLKLLLLILISFFMTQIIYAHEVEFHFDILKDKEVSITALAVSQIYDYEYNPTTNWQGGTVTKSEVGRYTGFDWFTDGSHLPEPVYIAYGIYKISCRGSYFYLNTMDGNYYERNIGYVRMDLLFDYDYAANSFTFEEPNWNGTRVLSISNGDTIKVWQNHNYYPFGLPNDEIPPYEPNQEVFNPKVYLKNKYLTYEDFGRLVVDDGAKYVESGDYANLKQYTSHHVKPEYQFYSDVNGDDVQHHHWTRLDEPNYINYSIEENIYVENWETRKTAHYEKTIPCTLKTEYIFGGDCPVEISFKDPWLIEADGSQPGIFHNYPAPFYPGNGALINQKQTPQNPNAPVYYLSVPKQIDDGDRIAIFNGWTVEPASGADLDLNSPETDVVFKEAGVTITANYYHWKRSDFKGSVPINLSINGNINVTDNVTVESGAKLTVESRSDFRISPSKSILIYGQLYAVGSTFFPDDPTNTSRIYWNGIRAYNGKITLRSVEIKGATWGVYADNSDTYFYNIHFENNHLGVYILYDNDCTIDKCTIINNNYGAYFYTSDILYTNNTCTNNIKGLILSRCTGNIWHNSFTDNSNTGVSINNISGVILAEWSRNPNYISNTIKDNTQYGIYIDGNSRPVLGGFDEDWKGYIYGGYNNFDHGSGNYDIYSANSSAIDARMNWWSSTPSRHGNFMIYPVAGGILPKSTSGTTQELTSLSPLERILFQADSLIADSLFTEAISLYHTLFTLAPDSMESVFAIAGLVYCYKKLQNNNKLIEELNALYNNYQEMRAGKTAYDYSVTEYTRKGEYQTALSRSKEVFEFYSKSNETEEEAAYALFEQSIIYEMIANSKENTLGKMTTSENIAKSKECKNRILHDYSHTEAANILRVVTNKEVEWDNENTAQEYIPKKIMLYPAYPNPFNLSTKIPFDLPEALKVTIKIYDILGREIWAVKEKDFKSGRHLIIWNGTNYSGQTISSGIYIIQIFTKNYVSSQKIVLIK